MIKLPKKEPKFTGTDKEKQEQYSKYREKISEMVLGRKLEQTKQGRPK